MGALVITHYQRLLNYIKPHFVHVFYNGRVVLSAVPIWPWSWKRRATTGFASSSASPSARTAD